MRPNRSKAALLLVNNKPAPKPTNKKDILGSKHPKPEVSRPEKVSTNIRQPQNRVLPARNASEREQVVETETRLLTNGPAQSATDNFQDFGPSVSLSVKPVQKPHVQAQPKRSLAQVIKKMERQARWNKIRKFVKAMYLARE